MIGLMLLIGAALIAGCYQTYKWIKVDPMYRALRRARGRAGPGPGPYWIIVNRKEGGR